LHGTTRTGLRVTASHINVATISHKAAFNGTPVAITTPQQG
jgi:hypothetical protein